MFHAIHTIDDENAHVDEKAQADILFPSVPFICNKRKSLMLLKYSTLHLVKNSNSSLAEMKKKE